MCLIYGTLDVSSTEKLNEHKLTALDRVSWEHYHWIFLISLKGLDLTDVDTKIEEGGINYLKQQTPLVRRHISESSKRHPSSSCSRNHHDKVSSTLNISVSPLH